MRPKRSAGLILAMFQAEVDLNEIGPKIVARIPLSLHEGERLLTSNWKVYLHALVDRDIEEAKEATEFSRLITEYLELCGYVVSFSNNVFCVVPKPRKENN